MREIKRYPNRKLYDTEQKRYVTLNDVARLIRDGHDVQVTDHASGEDLTAITLTQIIFEQEKRQAGFLPRSVLTGLIQAGGDRLSTLRRALASPLGLRRHVDDEILRRLNVLVLLGELDEAEATRLGEKLLSENTPEVELLRADELDKWLSDHHLPTRDDVAAIEAQLDELAQQLDLLVEQRH